MTSVDERDLAQRVRELRATGSSPKEIALALGAPKSKVAALVRSIAAADETPIGERELIGCWVSPGWNAGLTFDPRPEWPYGDPGDSAIEGMVTVVVARLGQRGRASVCAFLVDVFCLGVKNALPAQTMDRHAVREFATAYFLPYDGPPVQAPVELARYLVLGAVEYAHGLGFEPHPDFAETAEYLGGGTGPNPIGFGRDGTPFYIDGPNDDPNAVLATLNRTVGQGNYGFTTRVT